MKTLEHRREDLKRSQIEADLEAGIGALFRRRPALCGFHVRDAAHERLCVTEVCVYPVRFAGAPGELCDEIEATLLGLIEESPDSRGLLRGRTFARAFH